jgi:hypothetical protein
MDNYKDGTVLFDRITVLGRDFVHPPHRDQLCAFDFAFSVKPHMSKAKTKKGAPVKYEYEWEGHFNLTVGASRIRLHNWHPDNGLLEFEAKLTMIKEKIDLFLKEIKTRLKSNAKEHHSERHWLNKPETNYTGYLAFNADKEGGGAFSIADCHRTVVIWFEVCVDQNGKVLGNDRLRTDSIKCLESMGKGFTRAIKAIQELRKFFARELEADQG